MHRVLAVICSGSGTYRACGRGVSDGDTITILDDRKQQIKVRLAEIDTPESAQPYGSRAKQELSRLVFEKKLLVSKCAGYRSLWA